MSILIRGMEMPEECNACPLANYNMGTMYCKALPPSPKGYHVIRFEGKREDCPLVEVKEPHGRLIDADETVRIWVGATIEGSIKPLIDARPTVIEAEGREE